MPTFVAIVALTVFATFLSGRVPSAGIGWDLFDGFGYVALAVLVCLFWDSPSPARRAPLRFHILVSVLACVAVAIHGAGLLALNPVAVEYLKAKAPPYMLAGTAAGVGMLLLTLSSPARIRRRLFAGHRQFRRWHAIAGLVIVVCSIWHVVGSAFYLPHWYGRAALAIPAAILPLTAVALHRRHRAVPSLTRVNLLDDADRNVAGMALAAAIIAVLFSVVRNL